MQNIYNIPANYNFFENLSEFIAQKFLKDNQTQQLKYIKIFLPNRRSCREFGKILNSRYPNIILPKIKAISDISYDDFSYHDSSQNIQYLNNILTLKDCSKLEYLLFLAKEINKLDLFGFKQNFIESLKVSHNLAQLFEDIELQGIDFADIDNIDDSNLPENKKITLETLKILHLKIKKSLLNNDIYYGATKQNIIIDYYIEFLRDYPPKHPIIIAGSTGSVLSGKKLIKAIANHHYVILQGLTRVTCDNQNHPQYFLNNLLEFCNVTHEQVQDITLTTPMSVNERQSLLQDFIFQTYNIDALAAKKTDLEENFHFIQAQDQIKEAKMISHICQHTLKDNKNAAIITNNSDLINYIKYELDKAHIEFNDTTSKSISHSKLVEFITLILQNFENSCSSHSLLALLKHQYFDKQHYENLITDLECKILRNVKENNQIEATIKAAQDYPEIVVFVTQIHAQIAKIASYLNLNNASEYIITLCENFANKSWSQLLENEPAYLEIDALFQQISNENDIIIAPDKISALFGHLFAQTNYFLKSNAASKVQILSTIEARLLNFDHVIIASLNENDFPQIEKSGWLGKKIRKDLGIDRQLKKVGQSCYDFCNYLSNKTIFLTRHKQKGTQEIIESPFLLKFKNLAHQIGVDIDKTAHYQQYLEKELDIAEIILKRPQGSPTKEQIFEQISITDISKLTSNPYQIYIKKILQLKELKKIDYEPGYAEFGSFVHEILEHYIRDHKNENTQQNQEIFAKYFKNPNDKLIWWPKFENIFNNFKKIDQKFDNSTNFVEKAVSFSLKNLKIVGKIDRIIKKDDQTTILDYKTGQIPTKKDIICGLASQLSIAALIISQESHNPINALTYFKLSAFQDAQIKSVFNKEEEISQLIIAAQNGLEELITHFITQNNPFIATKNEDIPAYKSLIRCDEWE